MSASDGEDAERLRGSLVTGNFFSVIGVQAEQLINIIPSSS